MVGIDHAVEGLRSRISALEEELGGLKAQLAVAESTVAGSVTISDYSSDYETGARYNESEEGSTRLPILEAEEYKRYCRQMILPEVGIAGQICLRDKSVLVVGIGGLGCPAATYLAGAGVGTIGLIDGDSVELSNLHRQILHSTKTIGQLKVNSARDRLKDINPNIRYVTYEEHLRPDQAIDIFEHYDIILDCTDHPTSRYLISDAAVLARKPLVSASALKMEGQLLVLNNPPADPHTLASDGHCYRCVFPKPPPPESVTSCGEGGILGPVVGVMGVLMATEALKILLFDSQTIKQSKSPQTPSTKKPTMLLYSAWSDQPFRTVRLGGRRKDCASCSPNRTVAAESLQSGSLDYTAFCGARFPHGSLIPEDKRISAKDYKKIRSDPAVISHLVDVREKPLFDLAHLKNSINIPFSDIRRDPTKCLEEIYAKVNCNPAVDHTAPIYLICRLGNDSQVAMNEFQEAAQYSPSGSRNGHRFVADVKGGLDAWRREVDHGFPDF